MKTRQKLCQRWVRAFVGLQQLQGFFGPQFFSFDQSVDFFDGLLVYQDKEYQQILLFGSQRLKMTVAQKIKLNEN